MQTAGAAPDVVRIHFPDLDQDDISTRSRGKKKKKKKNPPRRNTPVVNNSRRYYLSSTPDPSTLGAGILPEFLTRALTGQGEEVGEDRI